MKQEKYLIIRVRRGMHCARGPKHCSKCAEASKNVSIVLLELVGDDGRMARPVIEVERDGDRFHLAFNIVKKFDTEEEARAYAKEHGITDVKFTLD
ncbi:MAG: hypothetical protein RTU30_13665 [Candidatus Thorarchaeota archaeon]